MRSSSPPERPTRDAASAAGSDSPPGNGRRPGRRTGRRFAFGLGLLILVVGIGVIASELAGWAYLRQPVESIATRLAGRQVAIAAPFRLRLLRAEPSVSTGGLSIAAPPWSKAPHFVRTGPARVAITWREVLKVYRGVDPSKPEAAPRIASISVAQGDVIAERQADGRASWQFGTDANEPPGGLVIPAVDRLEVDGARVVLRDEEQKIDVTAEVTLREGDQVERAGVRVDGRGRWRDLPVELRVRAPGILPAAAGSAIEGLDARASIGATRLRFDGRIGEPTRLMDVVGNFEVEGPSLGQMAIVPGLTLPATPPYRVRGWVSRGMKLIEARIESATIGKSRFGGEVRYDPTTTPPQVSGRVDGKVLRVGDLGPTVGASQDVPKSKTPPDRLLPDRRFDIPSLREMNADVGFAIEQFDPGTDLIRPFRNLRGQVVLKNGVLEVRDLATQVAGGQIGGTVRIAPVADQRNADFRADLRWSAIDLSQWLKQTKQRFYVDGRLAGSLSLSGRGGSTAEILDALDGNVRAVIRGGRISHLVVEAFGLDAAQALGVAVKGDELLDLRCALVDLKAKKGRVAVEAGMLDTPDTTVFGEGGVALGDETMNLRLVAAPKDWSPFSLRSPVEVKGTFARPDIGIDAKPIALKAVTSLVLAAVAPVTAILPFVDLGSNDNNPCADAIERMRKAPGEGREKREGRGGRGAPGTR